MYFKEKWRGAEEKEPLLGRFDSFQIDPSFCYYTGLFLRLQGGEKSFPFYTGIALFSQP